MFRSARHVSAVVAILIHAHLAAAADWSTYLHDRSRSATTAESLEPPLAHVWTFSPLAPPDPAWTQPSKEAARVRFDDAFHVAVADDRVYFGSSGDNHVYCLDATTGEILWTFCTDGPVRLAPSISQGKAYFGSDDGNVYCLQADSGEEVWRAHVADRDQPVIGHGRMISLWPVRTGVLVDDGVAYAGAGVFPSESIYVGAYDAQTGKRIWRNDVSGERGPEQNYDGISPQGYLLASESTLYVSSGRSMPAAFDRKDGRFLFYLNPGGKVGGSYALLTDEHLVAGVNEQRVYDSKTGATVEGDGGYAWSPAHRLIVDGSISYSLADHEITALDRTQYAEVSVERREVVTQRQNLQKSIRTLYRERYYLKPEDEAYQQKHDELSTKIEAVLAEIEELGTRLAAIEEKAYKWKRENDCRDSMILAGGTLFTGGEDRVLAIDAESGQWLWTGSVEGRASGLAVSNGRLFVSTNTGKIHCFQAGAPAYINSVVAPERVADPYAPDELTEVYRQAALDILSQTDIQSGFCLVLGAREGRLAYELASHSDLKVVGIEPDAEKVAAARRALAQTGLYGKRVTILQGDLNDLPCPTYFANLIVSDELLRSGRIDGSAEEMFRTLRPHGGTICLGQPQLGAGLLPSIDDDWLSTWHADLATERAGADAPAGQWLVAIRGALEGEGQWTHLYGNSSNTANSGDRHVKPPLGVLWFGKPGPERMIERHGRATGPLAYKGRLFVQGENVVMAYDMYNGSEIWVREIPGALRARADVDGSNLAITDKGLFVATRQQALRLDPATGRTLAVYEVPDALERPARWGMLAALGETVFGTSTEPLLEEYGARWQNPSDDPIDNLNAFRPFNAGGGMWRNMMRWPDWGREDHWREGLTGKMIVGQKFFAYDVESGALKWEYDGAVSPTSITFGNGVVFFADNIVTEEEKISAVEARRARYGLLFDEKELEQELPYYDVRRFLAFDAHSGAKLWEKIIDMTGSGADKLGLAYYQGQVMAFGHFSNHDGSQFSKGGLAWRRVTVFSAEDGSEIWSKELNYLRRPFFVGGDLIVEPRAVDARTGEYRTRIHPVTGETVPWEFKRGGHSCGVCTASDETFFLRSYSINYYDYKKDQGMLPVGGTRAGCWINMITAGGLALLPEASAGCTCSFPIRTTIAMAPQEYERKWSIFVSPGPLTPVSRWSINLGAPGDRKDDEGHLWFGYPRLNVPYGVKFSLNEKVASEQGGFFAHSPERIKIDATDQPWIYSSGVTGGLSCEIPVLGPDDEPAEYTVKLGFNDPADNPAGRRVFDVKLQGEVVLENFDIVAAAGGPNTAIVRQFANIPVSGALTLELVSKSGDGAADSAPLINSIEIIR